VKTKLTEMFGIETPIFAFSHCRDVVAAVSKAGGLGVLGAERKTPEELKIDLDWIEAHVGGRPYGVDVLFAQKTQDISKSRLSDIQQLVPDGHRQFVEDLLDKHNVPHLMEGEEDALLRDRLERGRGTPEYSAQLLEVAFKYPGLKLLVSALGPPPRQVLDRAHQAGIKVGAMIGSVKHAKAQREAGVDLLIASGYEAGGHTGEITTFVLTPEVVDAMAPVPVLAAGGIGRGRQMAAALALGAEGVWCGSIWLTTTESDTDPIVRKRLFAATSSDTIKTPAYSGKAARYLKSAWSDAWHAPGAPSPLMRPVQYLLRFPAYARINRVGAEPLMTTPVGQVVGQMNEETSVKQVVYDMLLEFSESVERLNNLVE